jgi:hypothetical protein
MAEKPGANENEPANPGRRNFLKALMGIGAVAAVGGGAEAVHRMAENTEVKFEEQAARIVLNSELREEPIPDGKGIDVFYANSGWSEEYPKEVFEKAVVLANKGLDVKNLQQGEVVKIPFKEGEK